MHTPFAVPEIFHAGPPTSWPLTAGAVWPQGGGPSAATCPETMEENVEVNGGGKTKIENYCHHLPHHLHQSNDLVVSSPLGD